MSDECMDRLVIGTDKHSRTDARNENTQRPKLAWGKNVLISVSFCALDNQVQQSHEGC